MKENEMSNFELYLAEFIKKISEENYYWILSHQKDSKIQRNYFLVKKIEHAEEQLLIYQAEIVKDFRASMRDLNQLKDHYFDRSFIKTEIGLRKEFERRIFYTKKLWSDYVEECKKSVKLQNDKK